MIIWDICFLGSDQVQCGKSVLKVSSLWFLAQSKFSLENSCNRALVMISDAVQHMNLAIVEMFKTWIGGEETHLKISIEAPSLNVLFSRLRASSAGKRAVIELW